MSPVSIPASADLSASQYKFVDVNTSGELAIVTVKGAKFAGVLLNAPAAQGRAGAVSDNYGICKVRAGAAVTAGSMVISDATARAITSDATDQFVLGMAINSVTAADEVLEIKIMTHQKSIVYTP